MSIHSFFLEIEEPARTHDFAMSSNQTKELIGHMINSHVSLAEAQEEYLKYLFADGNVVMGWDCDVTAESLRHSPTAEQTKGLVLMRIEECRRQLNTLEGTVRDGVR